METNENYNEEHNDQQKTSKTKEYVIIGILFAALLGSLGYNVYLHNQSADRIETLNIDLKDTESAKVILQQELDDLTAEYERAKVDIEAKDSLLSTRDKEIFSKQKEIQNILSKENVTSAELKKAQRMINSLNTDIAQYKKQISILTEKNDSLIARTDTLQYQQTQLSGELAVQTQRADDTEQKMKSTFSVSNYQITGLKVRNSGKEVETDKAKRIDKLRVAFDLDPNQFAESGQKEIFIAIYKPDGSLGKFKGASYGELETVNKGTIEYSDKVSFNYQSGSKQNITFDWEDFEFPKGTYKVDLYQNGMKIGQKSLDLR
ncbi:MAG: hypothetical protein WCY77_06700 [Weeksellaceae bacterium]